MALRHDKEMIYPSVEDLSRGGYNRYVLCIAASKCARKITDESYSASQSEIRDDKLSGKRAVSDEKPVNTAIKQMHRRCFDIIMPEESQRGAND